MTSKRRAAPRTTLREEEDSPLLPPGAMALNYNSDSAVYENHDQHRHVFYGPGTHYNTTLSSEDEGDEEDENDVDYKAPSFANPGVPLKSVSSSTAMIPRANWRGFGKTKSKRSNGAEKQANGQVNRFTRRSRMRSIKKHLREPPSIQKLRVSAYCTCDQLQLFKLLKWLERVETGQLPGGELNPDGWTHKMYMGAIHSTCAPPAEDGEDIVPLAYRQKDVFYFGTGCTVFWGLTRAEEQAHLRALMAFSVGPVKQVEVEDMDYTYGESSRIFNDAITLESNRASEKLAISFAMAQSAKLDVFEERVEETIQKTKHIPQNLATTGSIQYSQSDISKLIGRLFIVRNDVNLNSDMLDEPDFFWEDDEYEPLYKKMMKYLDVDNRVQILNTRLDILRELLDVLSQQLAHQHDTKLEWIVIWLIVAEVAVQIVWNILIKDILGFFPKSETFD
ncbi:hypothetical protein Poli38472_003785 [Pythium oligandrum]|uniref:DUF155 domain-containing protein n=1 Tax=Pythium oligandrum TaxID=41045 RepID=A0A8K1CNT9_PYTOL|nr:hypothetical protein Poli38472_003785 [Pythium oligandrum]|eukprot:TMW66020.1 hypothetical protein Poli38472_003785 [Pythium oligandrum]